MRKYKTGFDLSIQVNDDDDVSLQASIRKQRLLATSRIQRYLL